MKVNCIKLAGGTLSPATEHDAEAMRRFSNGKVYEIDIKEQRNIKFHRKYFALLNLGFDYFETSPVEYKGRQLTPEKNFDEYRRWVAVKAGFYDVVGYPDGSVRVRAKSISFASMTESEFEQLYSQTINVLMASVLHGKYDTAEQIDNAVNQLMNFC